ncbi:MAG: hypothetical protein JST75_04635 [Bacteroidetes bacterium]|nr:hypothetical protein [Bacteroidota bacterium]
MKNIIRLTTILTWFNLVISGLVILYLLLAGIASGYFLSFVVVIILPGTIVLHCYAALQLRKSIVRPDVPLSNQTPIGIRFVGFVVLIFGLLSLYNGITLLMHPDEIIKQIKQMPDAKNLDIAKFLRIGTYFGLIFSICLIANAVINFRLLKWYQMETSE